MTKRNKIIIIVIVAVVVVLIGAWLVLHNQKEKPTGRTKIPIRFPENLTSPIPESIVSPKESDTLYAEPIPEERFYLNGITICSTKQEVIKKLGKPKSIRDSYCEPFNEEGQYFIYDGLKIYFCGNEALSITCTSSKYSTYDDIKVGDSKEKLFKIYGASKPSREGEKPNHVRISYGIENTCSSFIFRLENDIIVEIELYTLYV
jgi:hypothetical protein